MHVYFGKKKGLLFFLASCKSVIRFTNIVLLSTLPHLALSTAAGAKELWVDTQSLGGSCSDTRSREAVSAAAPWCSLGPAGERTIPGDVVTVRQGTYSTIQTCASCNDNSVLQIVNGGNSSGWIRYRPFSGEKVVISAVGGAYHGIQIVRTYDGKVPSYVSVQGFEVHGFEGVCLYLNHVNNVALSDMDIHGCSQGAVELQDTADVVLEDSNIHENQLTGWTSAVDLYLCRENNIVRRNHIWSNTDLDPRNSEGHGLVMDTCKTSGSANIENNVIQENEGWCIATVNSNNAVIRNNSCWMNGTNRADTGEVSIGGSNHRIHNNILIPRTDRLAIGIKSGSQAIADHNLANGNWLLGWPSSLEFIIADPLLANPAAGDLHTGTDSPAIDAGDNANAASTDADGNARPQDGTGLGYAIVDLGAYEYMPSTSGIYGDINGDMQVDAADILLAQLTLQGKYSLTGSQFLRADVAPRVAGSPVPDGQFNAGDLLVITQLALGNQTYISESIGNNP